MKVKKLLSTHIIGDIKLFISRMWGSISRSEEKVIKVRSCWRSNWNNGTQ